MSLSFGRPVRIRARKEYLAVQDGGRRVSGRHMTVLARPNRFGTHRLGIIASRRLGDAVTRNRSKRRVREIFRLTEPDAIRPELALDIVVIPKKELAAAPFAALQREFDAALAKLVR